MPYLNRRRLKRNRGKRVDPLEKLSRLQHRLGELKSQKVRAESGLPGLLASAGFPETRKEIMRIRTQINSLNDSIQWMERQIEKVRERMGSASPNAFPAPHKNLISWTEPV